MKTKVFLCLLLLNLSSLLLAEDAKELPKLCRSGDTNCVAPPKPLSTADPDFPEEGRRKGIKHASVKLGCTIAPDGTAQDITIDVSAGNGFDESAVKCLKKWKFEPATYRGHPVAVHLQVNVEFNLR